MDRYGHPGTCNARTLPQRHSATSRGGVRDAFVAGMAILGPEISNKGGSLVCVCVCVCVCVSARAYVRACVCGVSTQK